MNTFLVTLNCWRFIGQGVPTGRGRHTEEAGVDIYTLIGDHRIIPSGNPTAWRTCAICAFSQPTLMPASLRLEVFPPASHFSGGFLRVTHPQWNDVKANSVFKTLKLRRLGFIWVLPGNHEPADPQIADFRDKLPIIILGDRVEVRRALKTFCFGFCSFVS